MSDRSAIDFNALLRRLPQVEQVLAAPQLAGTLAQFRRDVVKRLVQQEIAAQRREIERGEHLDGDAEPPTAGAIALLVAKQLDALQQLPMRRVINATGVVLHTNLGRAVLSPSARDHVTEIAAGYTDLELSLATGERSKRDDTAALLLGALLDCSATVVNNCAGAVFLALHALAYGREVITSRGELVEIGGGFRVPDIVRAGGCKLVEVGTTNRTRLSDYAEAITPGTALILKTHRSNFALSGFVEEASVAELAQLASSRGIPLVYDLGSGYIGALGESFDEPELLAALHDGASLVLFSGDKLLGGPQAGIAVGNQACVQALRNSPLWRAFRCDKLALAALEATLLEHLSGRPRSPSHPANVLARVGQTAAQAEQLHAALQAVQPKWNLEVIEAPGSWGGGSHPDEVLASHAVVVTAPGLGADQLDRRLRSGNPAVVGYKLSGRYALNVLALLEGDSDRLAAAIGAL